MHRVLGVGQPANGKSFAILRNVLGLRHGNGYGRSYGLTAMRRCVPWIALSRAYRNIFPSVFRQSGAFSKGEAIILNPLNAARRTQLFIRRTRAALRFAWGPIFAFAGGVSLSERPATGIILLLGGFFLSWIRDNRLLDIVEGQQQMMRDMYHWNQRPEKEPPGA